jgi:osmoprotectant transport system permease protein
MDYFIANYDRILLATVRHLEICAISIGLALALGIPLGIAAAKIRSLSFPVLGAVGVIYTVPTLAMFGLMIPLLGLGVVPAIAAIVLYSLLPVVQNAYTGIINVPPHTREAARALGMSEAQILWRVELPLSLPVLSAGTRTAVVNAVGMGTLASLIGAGGLGDLIFRGISTVSMAVVLAGSIPVVVMAVLADILLRALEARAAGRTGLVGHGVP